MSPSAVLLHPRLRRAREDADRDAAAGRARPGLAPRLGFGCDYNPEQWPEEVWAEDARLMQEAGLTFVTVAVFSWALLEPTPGRFHSDWLARVLDLMDRSDIGVDLATATASPPAWLSTTHPEVLPVDVDGRRLAFGSRQAWCPSSPAYRSRALALTEHLARRFGDHPALALWHVSNELGCHNAHCFCDISAAAFRAWLQDRYGTLDALNTAWGTAFWSQRYGRWEEVSPPRATTAVPNPTAQLDFRRFSSDELLAQYTAERDLLRELVPEVPVTTNLMVTDHIDGMDYWRWTRAMDPDHELVSNDHYLDGRLLDPHVELSFSADWTRGLAGGRPWILMEHSTSAVNWQPRNYPKAPHQMRRNTLQHVARGADTAAFFQWRASVAGAEKYHSALLPHAGTDSRVWREVVELGQTLQALGETAGSVPVAEVAMLLDYESWWAVQRPSLPVTDLQYLDRAHVLYRALWDAGVTVDVAHPSADLTGYRLVVAPTLHVLTDNQAAALGSYVEGGGHLLATYFSGIVDEHDHIRPGGYPGGLGDLLGIRVEEFVPLAPDRMVTLTGLLAGQADTWVEDLELRGAQALSSYADGPQPGVPAVTRHRFGSGTGWYVATRTDAATTAAVLSEVLAAAGVVVPEWPPGVEVVRRRGPDRSFAFVLNHSDAEVHVPLRGEDLLSGVGTTPGARAVGDDAGHLAGAGFLVPAGGVACIRER